MDSNYDGNSGFEEGTSVVIEAGEKIYVGDIISVGDYGIHLLETHRMESVGGTTEDDVTRWVNTFKGFSRVALISQANLAGISIFRAAAMTRLRLVELCVQDMIDAKNLEERDDLVTLSRPVETLLRLKDYRMRSMQDYGFEASLRPLDFVTPGSDEEDEDEEDE